MKKQIFLVAVLLHKYTTKGMWESTEMVISPKWILASSKEEANFVITREIPKEKAGDVKNLEILVKGF